MNHEQMYSVRSKIYIIYARTEQVLRIVLYVHQHVQVNHSPNTFHRRLGIFRYFLMRTVTVCANNGMKDKDAQCDSSLARDFW